MPPSRRKKKVAESADKGFSNEGTLFNKECDTSSSSSDSPTPRAKSTFAFPSSSEEDGSNTRKTAARKRKHNSPTDRVIVYDEYKSDSKKVEEEAKAKRQQLKEAKRIAKRSQDVHPMLPKIQTFFRSVCQTTISNLSSFLTFAKKNPWNVMWTCVVLGVFGGVLYLKSQEEYFSTFEGAAFSETDDVDHYSSLGVPRGATAGEIRKSYRTLSLRWHPDRNLGCDHCQEKFVRITKAYEILSDEAKREVYDTSSGNFETIPSRATSLTNQNYARLVLESDTPWLIQVFSDFDYFCKHFAKIWEAAATAYDSHLKFGRINAIRDADLLKKLPMRIRIYPAVFLYTPGRPTQTYNTVLNANSFDFMNWIDEAYPTDDSILHSKPLNTKSDLQAFAVVMSNTTVGRATVLIGSPLLHPSLEIKSLALRWSHVFNMAYSNRPNDLLAALEITEKTSSPGRPLLVMSVDSQGRPLRIVHIDKDRRGKSPVESFEEGLYRLQQNYAPYLNRQNADVLCRSNPYYRVYCLVAVDFLAPPLPITFTADNSTATDLPFDERIRTAPQIVEIISNSKRQHAEEESNFLSENTGTKESTTEEIHIQLVRLLTTPLSKSHYKHYKYLPGNPPRAFYKFWRNSKTLNSSPFFLIDFDGHQISKSVNYDFEHLEQLYFDLHDGVLKFVPFGVGGVPRDNQSKEALHSVDWCPPNLFESRCLYDFSARFWDIYFINPIKATTTFEWVSLILSVGYLYHIIGVKRRANAMSLLTEASEREQSQLQGQSIVRRGDTGQLGGKSISTDELRSPTGTRKQHKDRPKASGTTEVDPSSGSGGLSAIFKVNKSQEVILFALAFPLVMRLIKVLLHY